MDAVKSKWDTFIYNYQWGDYVNYIDGWIPKLAFSVPIIGYAILFNDGVSSWFDFSIISENSNFGLTNTTKLQFIYFGLIFLGLSNLIYRFKRPHCFKFATNQKQFNEYALDNFTIIEFRDMHSEIQRNGHLSMSGKTYDYLWEEFYEQVDPTKKKVEAKKPVHSWSDTKERYRDMLTMLFNDSFFRYSQANRSWLTTCLTISSIGYGFLAIPSVDLFIKVLLTVF